MQCMAIRWCRLGSRRMHSAMPRPSRQPQRISAGCLFAVWLAWSACAADHGMAGVVTGVLVSQPATLDTVVACALSDTSVTPRTRFEVGYHDLYHELVTDSSNTTSSKSIAESPYFAYQALAARGPFGVFAAWTRSSVYASWYDRDAGYRLTSGSGLHALDAAGWCNVGRRLLLGGRLAWSAVQFGNTSGFYTHGGVRNNLLRLGYGAFVAGGARAVNGAVYGNAGPLHSSITRIVSASNNGHSDFPVLLSAREIGARLNLRLPVVEAALRGALFRIETDTSEATVAPGLKTVVAAQGGTVGLDVRARGIPLSPALSLAGRRLHGDIGSFDGDTRYLVWNRAAAWRMHGALQVHLPRGIRTGLFGDYGRADSGSGHIEFFPFSSWTMFDPRYYRIDKAPARYAEAGCFVLGRLEIRGRHAILPSLDVSRLTLHGRAMVREREIIYLIPTYKPEQTYEYLEEDLLLLNLRLACALHVGGISIEPAVRQILPVSLKHGRASTGGGGRKGDSRVHGGTSVSLAVEMAW